MKIIIDLFIFSSFMFIPGLILHNIFIALKRHKKFIKRQELRKKLKLIKSENEK
jgi:hypothetical protein